MVIGRGGEKIRELQARTGAHIKVLQDGPHQTAAVKPVVIQGEPSAVEQARTLIEDLVKDEPAPPPAPVPTAGAHHYGTGSPAPDRDHRGSVTGPPAPSASHGLTRTEMLVPSSSVGLIIGTAGSTIKGMQQRTGARIQLQQGLSCLHGALLAATRALTRLCSLCTRVALGYPADCDRSCAHTTFSVSGRHGCARAHGCV